MPCVARHRSVGALRAPCVVTPQARDSSLHRGSVAARVSAITVSDCIKIKSATKIELWRNEPKVAGPSRDRKKGPHLRTERLDNFGRTSPNSIAETGLACGGPNAA